MAIGPAAPSPPRCAAVRGPASGPARLWFSISVAGVASTGTRADAEPDQPPAWPWVARWHDHPGARRCAAGGLPTASLQGQCELGRRPPGFRCRPGAEPPSGRREQQPELPFPWLAPPAPSARWRRRGRGGCLGFLVARLREGQEQLRSGVRHDALRLRSGSYLHSRRKSSGSWNFPRSAGNPVEHLYGVVQRFRGQVRVPHGGVGVLVPEERLDLAKRHARRCAGPA